MQIARRLGNPRTEVTGDDRPVKRRASSDLAAIAQKLHPEILDRLDLARVSELEPDRLRARLRAIVAHLVQQEGIEISSAEQASLVESILDELTGHGPLEILLQDPAVSDVLVNGPDSVYVERNGLLEQTSVRFRDDAHLIHTIQRMVAKVGRRIDEASPMVDARLPDGSRVNAIIPPLALDGPTLSIRRFGGQAFTGDSLVAAGAMSPQILSYLKQAVHSKRSILIAGGTGAGKTTLLNVLSGFIRAGERIISAEDAAELRLELPHVVRLESRPPNLEGKGAVTIRDLVRNALRMRPDRIIVGEVRGAEVLDMLQAMNTGHDGSMATVHANSADDATSRLMTMLGMTGTPLSEDTMANLIARALHVVVHVARMEDGKRRITEVCEVVGQDGSFIEMNPIFRFEPVGMTRDGQIIGEHAQIGTPSMNERLFGRSPRRRRTSGGGR
jgi:pilus assembly protein CpaF